MEINFISFILGISVVLVAGGLAVGVIGFFKIIKVKKHAENFQINIYNDLDKRLQSIYTSIEENREQASRDLRAYNQGIYADFDGLKRELDSRLDKLDNKIKNYGVKPIKEA